MIFWCIVIAIVGVAILTLLHWTRLAEKDDEIIRLKNELNILFQQNMNLINEVQKYNPNFDYFKFAISKENNKKL